MDMGLLFFPHPTNTAAIARRIEDLGYRSIVFADTQNLAPETWSQLILAATATSRIELGPGVTNPVSRDPAVTASASLGVQVASNGRLVLGIGRGDSSMAKIGRKPAPPADFELYLQRLRAYLDGDTVDRDGTSSRIEWLDGIDVPRVPIEVSATGPKVIEMAARIADRICFAVGADTERLAHCVALARRAAEAAGREPGTLRLGAYVNCVVHDDPAIAREAVRGGVASFAHFSGFPGMQIDELPEAVRKAAESMRTGYDMTHHGAAAGSHAQALEPEFIHRFGIAGPLDEARTRFHQIRDLGIDFVRVIPGSRDAPGEVTLPSIAQLSTLVDELAGGPLGTTGAPS
ncbi:MAG: LLM class flavin-dependent oxidoreductase [Acidimicrobiales bacterium]|nr:LLM class flavin-dependent oxidoreductase [Acidimicrobiales bacterium]MCB9393293.1 LLM class flavin-dependent oxidoreductase [Acidimicrobiaceae bacterium]